MAERRKLPIYSIPDPPRNVVKIPATLASLPDLPAGIILRHLSFQQLFADILQVLPHWYTNVKRIISRKQHLVLYIGNQDCHQRLVLKDKMTVPCRHELVDDNGHLMYPTFNIEENRLKLPTLNKRIARKLADLMPAIGALEICICFIPTPNSLDTVTTAVNQLLKKWSNKLTTLKIRCQFKDSKQHVVTAENRTTISRALTRILRVVNTLPNLKHLTIDFRDSLNPVTPLDLSVILNLTEFYFRSDDHMSILYNSLDRYVEGNDQLEKIGLGTWCRPRELFGRFSVQSGCTYQHKIVSQGDFVLKNPFDHFGYFHPLSRLETYQITKIDYSWRSIFISRALGSLTHLEHFCWALKSHNTVPGEFPIHPIITPLPSIKVLTLIFNASDHTVLKFNWPGLFPNLQIVRIFHTFNRSYICCTKCAIFTLDEHTPEQIMHNIRPCTIRLLKPLKPCVQLKKIYYCYNEMVDNVVVYKPEDL